MNRSSIVTAATCATCGRCCRSFRLWLNRDEQAAARLAFTDGVAARVVPQLVSDTADLVEIDRPCTHLRGLADCAIYGDPRRPKLCDEFPDNLFNSDGEGRPILDDDHAVRMIAAYWDYCPGVADLGRTEPDTAGPPAPPRTDTADME